MKILIAIDEDYFEKFINLIHNFNLIRNEGDPISKVEVVKIMEEGE